ncbi:MAG: hypothetical protein B1H12_04815 [Desulfobacteraceae bacterium 4484_190.2]|nr:MAG: hypothetical protein B1H12_04815 [Desulfobacteraceae bacterium 4484_190.2]
MFLRPLKKLRKTVGFRLTVWYSGIFIFSSLLLFGLTYFLLSSSLGKQNQKAIQLKLKELSAFFESGGMELLEREITIEKKFEKKTPFFIRVAGRGNSTLLLIIPYQWAEFDIRKLQKATHNTHITWIQLRDKKNKIVLEVASIRLNKDHILQVGKNTEDRGRILMHFRDIFAAVMIPLILLGFTGGTFLAFRALRPIRHLITTIHSIGTGRMAARVPSPQMANLPCNLPLEEPF